ncbi:MAG: PEP-CTERM sorting domain-containing protein [Planctomycetota bacterium]
MNMRSLFCVTASVVGMSVGAQADLIGEINFDAPAGTTTIDLDGGLNGGNGLPVGQGGTGFRNDVATGTVTNGGLEFGDLVTTGNAWNVTGQSGQWQVYRGLGVGDPFLSLRNGGASAPFGAEGETIWFSALFNVSDDSGNRRIQQVVDGSNTNSLQIGVINGNWGIQGANSVIGDSGIDAVAGETTLLVWSQTYDFDGGPGSIAELWVNPDVNALTPGTADAVVNGQPVNPWQGFRFRDNSYTIDELRFGETFADVTPVPEPGTLALAGLGGLMFLRRQRSA